MTKTLAEIYAPKPKDEKAFVAKHTIKKTTDKSPATKDADQVFKGSNVKTFNRSANRMGYNSGEDQKAYGVLPGIPSPTDQKTVTAIAPYTIKMGEEEDIDEANLVNKKKKDAYIQNIGKKKAARPNVTAAKKAGRAELRKEDFEDFEMNDEILDVLIDIIDDYLLTQEDE